VLNFLPKTQLTMKNIKLFFAFFLGFFAAVFLSMKSDSAADLHLPEVMGIHMIKVKDGVSEQKAIDFILNKELPSVKELKGMNVSLCKADRGNHAGDLFVVYTMSKAQREKYFPSETEYSQEIIDYQTKHADIGEEGAKLYEQGEFVGDLILLGSGR